MTHARAPVKPGGAGTTFRAKNTSLKARAVEILAAERPMTLRALYYRLVSAGALANAQAEYKRLGRIMTRLRESSEVPVTGWLVDRVRSSMKPPSWSGLADYGDVVRDCYRKNLWAEMPHHVELFVEKDAIAGTVYPVNEEYDVKLNVIRGDVSVSFAGEIAALWARIRKPIAAYYLGDFDPAGFGIEDVLRAKLARYSGRPVVDVSPGAKVDLGPVSDPRRAVYWCRLGVNAGDFEDFDLVRLPVKRTASRAKAFIAAHGENCAEVDAIPPDELRARVRAAIESHIDQDRWQKLKRVEEVERDTLGELLDTWGGAA